MKINDLFKSIATLVSFENSPSEIGNKSLSNNDLITLLRKSFIETIQFESIKDRRLLYDVSFLILIHPDDYAKRELALPIVTQEAVNMFYEIIEDNKSKYKNFLPAGNNWFFQYTPTEKFDITNIEKGRPFIISTLSALKTNWGNISGKAITVSIIANNSKYERFDINPEIFKNLDVFARGIFRIKINSELTHLSSPPKVEGEAYATLKYIDGGMEYTYNMQDSEITLTLKTESTPMASNILAIESRDLKKNHARIKYIAEEDRFEITTEFDDVVVNQKPINQLTGKENLPNEASIMLGWFNIKFKKVVG